jgi:hypothetical protein
MLKEIRDILHNKCKEYLKDSGITVYRGRKDKIYIGGVYFNTVYRLAKKEEYKVNNETAKKLLTFFGYEIDEEFLKENNILKLKISQKAEVNDI